MVTHPVFQHGALSSPCFPCNREAGITRHARRESKDVPIWNYVTLVRWRKALELRYTTWSDPHFSVLWQDTDYANNDVSVKPIANSTDLSNIAKTFVQVCRGEDKCITNTLYFAKTATR